MSVVAFVKVISLASVFVVIVIALSINLLFVILIRPPELAVIPPAESNSISFISVLNFILPNTLVASIFISSLAFIFTCPALVIAVSAALVIVVFATNEFIFTVPDSIIIVPVPSVKPLPACWIILPS